MGISSCLALLENEKDEENADSRGKGAGIQFDYTKLCGNASFEGEVEWFLHNHEASQGSHVVLGANRLLEMGETLMSSLTDQKTTVTQTIEEVTQTWKHTTVKMEEIYQSVSVARGEIPDETLLVTLWESVGDAFIPGSNEDDGDEDDDTLFMGCKGMEDPTVENPLIKQFESALGGLKEPDSSRDFTTTAFCNTCFTSAFNVLNQSGRLENWQKFLPLGGCQRNEEEQNEELSLEDMYVNSCKEFCEQFAEDLDVAEAKVHVTNSMYVRYEMEEKTQREVRTKKLKEIRKIEDALEQCSQTLTVISPIVRKVEQHRIHKLEAKQNTQKLREDLFRLKGLEKKWGRRKDVAMKKQLETSAKCKEHSEFIRNVSCELTKIRTRMNEKKIQIESHNGMVRESEAELEKIDKAWQAYIAMKDKLQEVLVQWLLLVRELTKTVTETVTTLVEAKLTTHEEYLKTSQAADEVFVELGRDLPMAYKEMIGHIKEELGDQTQQAWLAAHIKKTVISEKYAGITSADTSTTETLEIQTADFQAVVTTFMSYCQEETSEKGFCRNFLPGWYEKKGCSNQEQQCEYPCQGPPCAATQGVGRYLLDLDFTKLSEGKTSELEELKLKIEEDEQGVIVLQEELQVWSEKLKHHQGEETGCLENLKKVQEALKKITTVDRELLDNEKKGLQDALKDQKDIADYNAVGAHGHNAEIASELRAIRKTGQHSESKVITSTTEKTSKSAKTTKKTTTTNTRVQSSAKGQSKAKKSDGGPRN